MRRGHTVVIGAALLTVMLLPASMLFSIETPQPFGLTSSTANWYYSQQATDTLNEIQSLAAKARRTLEPLQVQETDLSWQVQSDMLGRAKYYVNRMGSDLLQLEEMKGKLEPWQQSLINKVTPSIHEMVYQLDQAIGEINKYQDAVRLSLTQYPQNISMICRNADQITGTIGTVKQYVQAEEKMAALERSGSSARS
jgi:hypothetical protein